MDVVFWGRGAHLVIKPMSILEIIDRWFFKKPAFREAVTKLLYGSNDREVRLFGETLLVNTLRENGYYRSARFAEKAALFRDEAGVLMNLAQFVRPGGHFIDAGANVGVFSTVFSRFTRLHPGFGVTAFEVHPSTYARLKVNADRHGFRAIPVALGEEAGRLEFIGGAVSHVTTLASKANAYSLNKAFFSAECRTLDSFEWNSPDIILKIDVEGQEYEVLAGGARLLASGRVIAVFIDGFEDCRIPQFLEDNNFLLRNARTLEPWVEKDPWLLALRSSL
jgi:FkbM family methyltransferase